MGGSTAATVAISAGETLYTSYQLLQSATTDNALQTAAALAGTWASWASTNTYAAVATLEMSGVAALSATTKLISDVQNNAGSDKIGGDISELTGDLSMAAGAVAGLVEIGGIVVTAAAAEAVAAEGESTAALIGLAATGVGATASLAGAYFGRVPPSGVAAFALG